MTMVMMRRRHTKFSEGFCFISCAIFFFSFRSFDWLICIRNDDGQPSIFMVGILNTNLIETDARNILHSDAWEQSNDADLTMKHSNLFHFFSLSFSFFDLNFLCFFFLLLSKSRADWPSFHGLLSVLLFYSLFMSCSSVFRPDFC